MFSVNSFLTVWMNWSFPNNNGLNTSRLQWGFSFEGFSGISRPSGSAALLLAGLCFKMNSPLYLPGGRKDSSCVFLGYSLHMNA